MKTDLYLEFDKNAIIMTSTFVKKCRDTNSAEYAQLQSVRRDYPNYHVATRQIKHNTEMEHYKGLSYAYMEDYIRTHETGKDLIAVLNEFGEMIHLSKCHSKRYPVIKQWFLDKYPEIVKYGMPKDSEKEAQDTKTVDLPLAANQ